MICVLLFIYHTPQNSAIIHKNIVRPWIKYIWMSHSCDWRGARTLCACAGTVLDGRSASDVNPMAPCVRARCFLDFCMCLWL